MPVRRGPGGRPGGAQSDHRRAAAVQRPPGDPPAYRTGGATALARLLPGWTL